MRYRAIFWGRKNGAIGKMSAQCVEFEAKDEKEAQLKPYETHEHITNLRLIVLEEPKP